MDHATLAAYDSDAAAFARDWHEQPAPSDLHAVITDYFIRAGKTADIGCGSGREVAWLNANGFAADGYDACEGLLREAQQRYPQLKFAHSALPELKGVAPGRYDNILCETVIMHLDHAEIGPSVRRMLDLLAPCGILYLSWRVTEGADARDKQGRLYAAFDAKLVRDELSGTVTLLDQEVVSASSGKKVHRLVVKKSA